MFVKCRCHARVNIDQPVDPDEALRHLRRESQRRHIKVTEVAARIVADHGSGGRGTPSSPGSGRGRK